MSWRVAVVRVAVLLLLARFLDLHLLVAPPVVGSRPWTILWAVGPVLLGLSLLLLLVLRKFGEAPAVPRADPFLVESLPPSEGAGAAAGSHGPAA